MTCINEVRLLGHVGRDPEIKAFQSGDRVANLSLATTRKWRDKQTDEVREATEWHSVVVRNEQVVRYVEQYVRKGSRLIIDGELRTRKWTDSDGATRYSTEVVVGPRGRLVNVSVVGRDDRLRTADQTPSTPAGRMDPPVSAYDGDLDDEVPF